jgi:hypothetical protein
MTLVSVKVVHLGSNVRVPRRMIPTLYHGNALIDRLTEPPVQAWQRLALALQENATAAKWPSRGP